MGVERKGGWKGGRGGLEIIQDIKGCMYIVAAYSARINCINTESVTYFLNSWFKNVSHLQVQKETVHQLSKASIC